MLEFEQVKSYTFLRIFNVIKMKTEWISAIEILVYFKFWAI